MDIVKSWYCKRQNIFLQVVASKDLTKKICVFETIFDSNTNSPILDIRSIDICFVFGVIIFLFEVQSDSLAHPRANPREGIATCREVECSKR